MQLPTVGRTVHYVARGSADGFYPAVCRAAIVTEVFTDWSDGSGEAISDASLCVLNPTGLFFNERVSFCPSNTPGTWHWPERVE